eukprot:8289344-Pyramimonas_sp.AAC.1
MDVCDQQHCSSPPARVKCGKPRALLKMSRTTNSFANLASAAGRVQSSRLNRRARLIICNRFL